MLKDGLKTQLIISLTGKSRSKDHCCQSLKIDTNKATDPQAHAVEVLVTKLNSEAAKPEQYGKVANGLFRAFDGDQEKFYKNIDETNEHDYEVIHAKYVVGSDGAHSWEKAIKYRYGRRTNRLCLGVLDMVPITNFLTLETVVPFI